MRLKLLYSKRRTTGCRTGTHCFLNRVQILQIPIQKLCNVDLQVYRVDVPINSKETLCQQETRTWVPLTPLIGDLEIVQSTRKQSSWMRTARFCGSLDGIYGHGVYSGKALPPPPREQTNTCENITFSPLR